MTAYVALLRAVNVGGTGKLPMAELKRMAEEIGLARVRTYIASGNLLFESDLCERQVKTLLENRLARYAGKAIGVIVRSADEMAAVAAANPFADRAPNQNVAIFLDAPPGADAIDGARGRRSEEIALGTREIYVHYPGGIAQSKLRIPAASGGTTRNLNSVTKLAVLART